MYTFMCYYFYYFLFVLKAIVNVYISILKRLWTFYFWEGRNKNVVIIIIINIIFVIIIIVQNTRSSWVCTNVTAIIKFKTTRKSPVQFNLKSMSPAIQVLLDVSPFTFDFDQWLYIFSSYTIICKKLSIFLIKDT
jgi:hypothetical protein